MTFDFLTQCVPDGHDAIEDDDGEWDEGGAAGGVGSVAERLPTEFEYHRPLMTECYGH